MSKFLNKEFLLKKLNSISKVLSTKSVESWAYGTILASDLSKIIANTDWFNSLNEFKSEVSKAMDSDFIKQGLGAVDTATDLKFTASNHRIIDEGHTFFESINRALDVGESNNWSSGETFYAWAKAYTTDLSSPAGMPALGDLTDNVYDLLRTLGFDEHLARDIVTINGQEAVESLLGGSIAAVSVFFAWKAQDKENFSKAISSLMVGSAIAMNPVSLVIATVALAFGYNSLVCKNAFIKGAFVSGVSLAISAAIPGPLLIGLLPAVIAAIYLNKKMGKDFDITEFTKNLYSYTRSEDFKKNMDSAIRSFTEFKSDQRKAV